MSNPTGTAHNTLHDQSPLPVRDLQPSHGSGTVCVMGNKPDRDPKDAAEWAKVDDLIAQIDKADQKQREAAEKANRDNR